MTVVDYAVVVDEDILHNLILPSILHLASRWGKKMAGMEKGMRRKMISNSSELNLHHVS